MAGIMRGQTSRGSKGGKKKSSAKKGKKGGRSVTKRARDAFYSIRREIDENI